MKTNRIEWLKLLALLLSFCLLISSPLTSIANAIGPDHLRTSDPTGSQDSSAPSVPSQPEPSGSTSPSEPSIPETSAPPEPSIPETSAPPEPSIPETSAPPEPSIPEGTDPSEPQPPVEPDNEGPTLEHIRLNTVSSGENVTFIAIVHDDDTIVYVRLYYRALGRDSWNQVDLSPRGNDTFTITISAALIPAGGMEYYLEASDGTNITREGSPEDPILVAVKIIPTITSVAPSKVEISRVDDGINAVVMGRNFAEGMIVTIGGKEITYQLISSSIFHFQIPENDIGIYDISITLDGETYTYEKKLTYAESMSMVKINSLNQVYAGEQVRLPIAISTASNIFALDVSVMMDPEKFSAVSFEFSHDNPSALSAYTVAEDGTVRISIASTTPLVVDQPIGYLVATVNPVEEITVHSVDVLTASLNAVEAGIYMGCRVIVRPTYTIEGLVTYYNGGAPIAGVTVTLSTGEIAVTDENGKYSFTGLRTQDVTVELSFSGAVNYAISAQDAALVLQAAAAETSPLTALQQLAADVDGDGKVTAMDAVYILKRDVGNLDAFPADSQGWVFEADPENKYDFSGILLGDVTGNWTSDPADELE